MSNLYEYSATLANGTEASLSDYKGQVLLVVNTCLLYTSDAADE